MLFEIELLERWNELDGSAVGNSVVCICCLRLRVCSLVLLKSGRSSILPLDV
jgi:hypothetical protein